MLVGPVRSRTRQLVKRGLTHPLARRLTAPLRAAWWALRGAGATSPPFPDRVDSILFVCLGNICRSPFAAKLAARLLAEAGRPHVSCASAGIRPSQDRRSPPEACRASSAYGISLDAHVPQPLTRELMESHDVVVVMEWRHLMELHEAYPHRRDRVHLLPLSDGEPHDAYERCNIADPFGQPRAAFDECYVRIERSLRRWLERMP